MKGVVGVAIVLALTVAAGAKPAPVGDLNRMDDRTPTLARNDVDIDIGPRRSASGVIFKHRNSTSTPAMFRAACS